MYSSGKDRKLSLSRACWGVKRRKENRASLSSQHALKKGGPQKALEPKSDVTPGRSVRLMHDSDPPAQSWGLEFHVDDVGYRDISLLCELARRGLLLTS